MVRKVYFMFGISRFTYISGGGLRCDGHLELPIYSDRLPIILQNHAVRHRLPIMGLSKQAVMGISEVLRRRSVDLSSLGPLCHILARLVASEHEAVVGYAARSLSFLVLDDDLRPLVARAGIPSVLATALERWKGEYACLREILG